MFLFRHSTAHHLVLCFVCIFTFLNRHSLHCIWKRIESALKEFNIWRMRSKKIRCFFLSFSFVFSPPYIDTYHTGPDLQWNRRRRSATSSSCFRKYRGPSPSLFHSFVDIFAFEYRHSPHWTWATTESALKERNIWLMLSQIIRWLSFCLFAFSVSFASTFTHLDNHQFAPRTQRNRRWRS
jgi:hypothetical protein